MKRVTKKAVREALDSFTGWNFAHDFKESQKLILYSHANLPRLTDRLSLCNINVADMRPTEPPLTGYLKLARKE